MKKIITSAVLLIALTLISTLVWAQNNVQELVIPLSNPGQRGSLEVSLNSGVIDVTGYPGKEVIVKVSTDQKKVENEGRDGLKKIPNTSIGLKAREENNHIEISSSNWNQKIYLSMQVPENFDLELHGMNHGKIMIKNVSGDMDISHLNGDITMTDVSGAAVVSSQNGDVKVGFRNITSNAPMAFSSFNGDVDVTFPSDLKATVKMKSDHGDLFTDFDINLKKTSPKVEKDKDSGVYEVAMEEWVMGDINGGGPEFSFKTFNGDILIRKK